MCGVRCVQYHLFQRPKQNLSVDLVLDLVSQLGSDMAEDTEVTEVTADGDTEGVGTDTDGVVTDPDGAVDGAVMADMADMADGVAIEDIRISIHQ